MSGTTIESQISSPQATGRCCDLCGGTQFRKRHDWDVGNRWNPATIPIAVWDCESCQLVTLHPVPTAQQLPDSGDWWSSQRRDMRRRRWFKVRWERIKNSIFACPVQRLVRQTRKAISHGRLLDVGAGHGPFLDFARSHFDCVALEPSPIATKTLRNKGYQVIESTFEEADIAPQSFDVVNLDSVIEHVHSPTAVLAKINQVLRPGGIVTLKTPKFGGPAYRMHGSEWNGFRHGHHTFLYTGQTLGALLEKAGFKVLTSPRRDRPLDDILILWGRKVREVSPQDFAPIDVVTTRAAA